MVNEEKESEIPRKTFRYEFSFSKIVKLQILNLQFRYSSEAVAGGIL